MPLPPGQVAVEGFPRFGTHFQEPPPDVPPDPVLEVAGAVARPVCLPVGDLARLPRHEMVADLHYVAGWSATDLRWEGVPFEAFYRKVIEPSLDAGATVTHLAFVGLDGYRSIVRLDDALEPDVLLADHLDGRPLDGDHGAPLRLVSPEQYGFISTKHLCRVEPHTRARVWEEERHRYLPAWVVRDVYRLLNRPIRSLSARGSRHRVRA